MVIPPHQVTEFSSLIPNYSPAPSSVCTSDSGGGSGRHGKLRTVRLHRRLLIGRGTPTFGFSVRGGREHGTGFFVSAVEPGSEAHCQGLRIGDQIFRINGYSVEDAIHREVLQYIQSQNHLELRVRSVGMIPVKDKRTDPLTWRVVEDTRILMPIEVNANTRMMLCKSEEIGQEIRLILNVAPRTKLGCGICKGPEWKPGIFVQFTKENGLARESGLRPGDQILQCNGVPFIDIAFSDAVDILKSARQLDLIVKKGGGLDLFPGESSGYNSSASSVNGDQSPSWEDTKRLSVVKEESVELEERLGQLDVSQRIIPVVDRNKDWDQIEEDWEKEDEKSWKHNSSVGNCRTCVHIGEVGSHHEANRDMSELSLASSSSGSVGSSKEHSSKRQSPEENKRKDGSRLAEIRMVSQQLETTTVVVEVHQSDEGDKCVPKQLVKSPSNSSFASIGSSASSSLSSAISEELKRRSKRRETEGCRETEEQKKDILKAIGGEKRQQHEQLMDEFKRAHRKMFAHTQVPEKEESSAPHPKPPSQIIEERERRKHQQQQQQEQEVKQSNVSPTQQVDHASGSKNKPPPPPPPPMPPDERSSVNNWNPPSPVPSVSSSIGSPPSCPTPDYDTSSSSSTPSLTLPFRNRNSVQSQNQPRPVSSAFPSSTQSSKTKTSNESPSNTSHNKVSDSVEMESLESYKLNNPQSPKPKPPPTYFVPVRSKNTSENGAIKQKRPVSVTIGEYPSNAERRAPTRFDFLTTQATEINKPGESKSTSSSISCQLQSELVQTLSRSNLRKHTESQLQQVLQNLEIKEDAHHKATQNETTTSKSGTVIITVNSEPVQMVKDSTSSTNGNNSQYHSSEKVNMMHIKSNNTSSTKISLTSGERSNHVSGTVKPAIRSAAEKIANSLAMNNRAAVNATSNKPGSNETESLKTSANNKSSPSSCTNQRNGILKNSTSTNQQNNCNHQLQKQHKMVLHQKSITFGEITTVIRDIPGPDL